MNNIAQVKHSGFVASSYPSSRTNTGNLELALQQSQNTLATNHDDAFIKALELFREASMRVPAYKDFLKKNNINPDTIKTLEDFKRLPIMDKKNYLRAYPLNELCWDGKLSNLHILSSSSGSTGEPFLWPRGEAQDLEGSSTHEKIFKEVFHIDKHKTLFIVCFAMGTWISGPFSLSCAANLTKKGYDILTVTPGIDSDTTFALFKNLSPYFDQIIISGYPPFIKDLLDLGPSQGINWKKHNIKFLFAAEGFSEKWRKYVHEKVGAKDNITTSINIYGSADAAVLGHETPLTTKIRLAVSNNSNKVNALFGEHRLPTLAQYDPTLKYFEEIDSSLIFTTRSGIPLIRYSIGDSGGVYTYEEMFAKLDEIGIEKEKVLLKGKKENAIWRMPFVYVFGRKDFTVTLYGLLIYPEHIKFGLEKPQVQKYITGKFVMSIEYDENQNQYLLLRIELANGLKPTKEIKNTIKSSIVTGLKQVNSEYNRLHHSINGKALPVIELIENGNVEYFRRGAKQRWVKKISK